MSRSVSLLGEERQAIRGLDCELVAVDKDEDEWDDQTV